MLASAKLPHRKFPLRVGDGDEKQVVRLVAQQAVAFGYHLVPVVAAREPTTVAARRCGTEIRLTLLPFRVVRQLASAVEPPYHLLLTFAALLHSFKVWQAQLGQEPMLPFAASCFFEHLRCFVWFKPWPNSDPAVLGFFSLFARSILSRAQRPPSVHPALPLRASKRGLQIS